MVMDVAVEVVTSAAVVTPLVTVPAVTGPEVTTVDVHAAAAHVAVAIAAPEADAVVAIKVSSALAVIPDSALEKVTRPRTKGLYKVRSKKRDGPKVWDLDTGKEKDTTIPERVPPSLPSPLGPGTCS